ncbi:hypothetical protein BDY19DRAFT_923623 [Irpex rosettiformis]|uniref:Uncharacterized protein n=1 Tax=Irpex rosettiformis TaxID=378272 RepID=A0ACB8UGL1_9APHY|nr:hypothetical protein BDY19DRAFT_923623 [Irpex rosettiformis]
MDSRELTPTSSSESDSSDLQPSDVRGRARLQPGPKFRENNEHSSPSHHNASQPLLQLPNEVLCLILSLIRTHSPLRFVDKKGYISWRERRIRNVVAYQLGWLNVTHVCRRLRHTALGYPALWNRFDIGESESCMDWLPELLQRSRNVPIDLRLHPIKLNDGVVTTLGQPAISSRIKSLFFPVLRTLLNNPAHRLEKLDMILDKSSGVKAMLSEDLFSSHAPCLRSLSLSGFDLPWSALTFHALTNLSIVCAHTEPGETPDIEYIWDPSKAPAGVINKGLNSSMKSAANTLRLLPLLQTLTLKHALPTEDIDITDLPQISLPHLRELEIVQHTAKSCFLFLDLLDVQQLRHFKISSTVSVEPRGEALWRYYRPLARFTSDFARCFPSLITELTTRFTKSAVTIDASAASKKTSRFDGKRIFVISLHYAEDPSTLQAFRHRHACLEPILDALPLDKLKSVSFYDDIIPEYWAHIVDYSLWSNIFDKCSSAKIVSADSIAVTPLIPLLGSCNPRAPAFPSLKKLKIETDHVVREYFAEGVERPATESYEFAHEQCLLSRSGHAPLLKELSLSIRGLDEANFADVVKRTPSLSFCVSERFRCRLPV